VQEHTHTSNVCIYTEQRVVHLVSMLICSIWEINLTIQSPTCFVLAISAFLPRQLGRVPLKPDCDYLLLVGYSRHLRYYEPSFSLWPLPDFSLVNYTFPNTVGLTDVEVQLPVVVIMQLRHLVGSFYWPGLRLAYESIHTSVFVLCDISHLSDGLGQCRQVPPSLSQRSYTIWRLLFQKKNADPHPNSLNLTRSNSISSFEELFNWKRATLTLQICPSNS
jgi:hypothetical protein